MKPRKITIPIVHKKLYLGLTCANFIFCGNQGLKRMEIFSTRIKSYTSSSLSAILIKDLHPDIR